MRLWLWALAGWGLGLLLSAVFYAPANWVAAGVAHASQGKVQLADAQGRVWQGSARLLLIPGGQRAVLLPGRVQWTLGFAGFGLRLQVLPDCCASRAVALHFQPSFGEQRLQVQDLDVRLPAALLAGLGTPFNTVGFGGTVQLRSPQLLLSQRSGKNWQLQGSAQMQLSQLSSSLSTLPALGSYQVDVTGGAEPQVQLRTLTGVLQMQGQGGWHNGRFGFSGQAQAAPGSEASLDNILNVIGQRQGVLSMIRI